MNKTPLFVTTLWPASARTMDETCDRLDGGAEGWRRLAGGVLPLPATDSSCGMTLKHNPKFPSHIEKTDSHSQFLAKGKVSWFNFHRYRLLFSPLCSFTVTLESKERFPKLSIFEWDAEHLPSRIHAWHHPLVVREFTLYILSLIHIWRCRRSTLCRSRWLPYH